MKFFIEILINILWLYVILPIFIIGITAWLWAPMFFEFRGAFIIGIIITILTLVVAGMVDYKLNDD